eukprot:CAMPEP_0114238160 /NCGR_PEP_ID=MMETSP0058-20121206/7778_1 /TAXON_ID=36894 /ORGANISM="Pyramimonas parkeae, CCMP726" /LENGTH=340 /DNA_ID=CAMNT_0001350255 /DNA_START=370 /DNA_END=1392 /DNA_ORIENTATION=+
MDSLSGRELGFNNSINQAPTPKARPKERSSMQRSQLGRQVDSQKRTGAAYGFGTAKRFPSGDRTQHKQYISKEHMKNAFGMERTPGPGTYLQESAFGSQCTSERRTFNVINFQRQQRFAEDAREQRQKARIPAPWNYKHLGGTGLQVDSRKATEPRCLFGTEGRHQYSSVGKGFEEHLHGKDSPGPVYEPDQSMGRQAASGRGSGPAFVFGSEQCHTDPKVRSPMERRAAAIPGPGQYTLEGSCNPQANSLRRSRPAFGMGSATRDQAGMASLENARAPAVLGGKFSPGVGMYDEKTMAFRKVINSTKPNGPTHVFGTDEKLARNRTTGHLAPGPGSYCV